MSFKQFKILVLILAGYLAVPNHSCAQSPQEEQHIEVSLRMIGHQLLLNSGDSTSRVLPIKRENDRFRIRFEAPFEFSPQQLAATVDSVIRQSGIARNYIVAVEECASEEVVYSFKIDDLEQSDIIPCGARLQPKSCYSLLFTFQLAQQEDTAAVAVATQPTYLNPYNSGALVLLLLVILFILWKRLARSKTDPNLISMGEYLFDKRNTELIIRDQKIELSSKEADLLHLLYTDANTTVEREVLLNMVWGDQGDYVGRTLDVFISKLRKKLEFDSKVKIVNIRGVGYKLVLDI
ncbi:winged helix-turn-helix domain-containing protein [Muriicola sp. Z0-33]|uniref:winged helix-turn-helix domain-containing protein n=1 Tax=Muriicola sp. Z0-33 TaxID=2816957 RepID=UPI002238B2A7|nr:winged helix-turn-helix domain-containing protein [Muriicola sp. Z0-33]